MDEALWTRVESLLDQRRDPLLDAGLARDLATRPQEREVVRRLVARLSLLGESSRSSARAIAWIGGGLLAAAVLAVLRPWRDHRVAFHPSPVAGFELTVEHRRADPPRLAREVLSPRKVVAWQHDGDGS